MTEKERQEKAVAREHAWKAYQMAMKRYEDAVDIEKRIASDLEAARRDKSDAQSALTKAEKDLVSMTGIGAGIDTARAEEWVRG